MENTGWVDKLLKLQKEVEEEKKSKTKEKSEDD